MPETKLYYYPALGRAEVIRLALSEAGQDWEFVTCDMSNREETGKFLSKCRELGGNLTTNVPMLYTEGKYLTQSGAITLYVARKYGLYSSDVEAAFKIDNLLCAAEDLRSLNYKPLKLLGATADDVKAYKEKLPSHLKNFERLLGSKDYFADDKFSIADISIYEAFNTASLQIPNVLDSYPCLKSFQARVSARPNISKWVNSDKRAKLFAAPALD